MRLLGQKALQEGGESVPSSLRSPLELWLDSGGRVGSWMSSNGNLVPWCDWEGLGLCWERAGEDPYHASGNTRLPLGPGWRAAINEN